MSKRFRVTISLTAEDLTKGPGDLSDAGSDVTIIQNSVDEATRHEIEKRLASAMVLLGDEGLEAKQG